MDSGPSGSIIKNVRLSVHSLLRDGFQVKKEGPKYARSKNGRRILF